ncbi:hypothetical protein EVAR_68811_1 [Eumeta japonica]|uniref:Mariner Mos1 transposase n=1 Tax=Eumeta variegata TaxID=151549 RepID=A0A4C1Z0E5_EUMVA|nr:hypothetical protein EVAR_68811_1 [Eumeta japonica]
MGVDERITKFNMWNYLEVMTDDNADEAIAAAFRKSASCHTSAEKARFLECQKIELTGHPSYSPDLAPKDFYLFPIAKNKLRGQRFSGREEAVDAFKMHVLEIPQAEWKKCNKNWFLRIQMLHIDLKAKNCQFCMELWEAQKVSLDWKLVAVMDGDCRLFGRTSQQICWAPILIQIPTSSYAILSKHVRIVLVACIFFMWPEINSAFSVLVSEDCAAICYGIADGSHGAVEFFERFRPTAIVNFIADLDDNCVTSHVPYYYEIC